MSRHPASEELLAFLQGEAPEDEREAIARHLQECPDCEREAGRLQEAAALVAFAAEDLVAAARPLLPRVAAALALAAAVLGATWLLWFRPPGTRFLERVGDEWRVATGSPEPASLVLAVDRPIRFATPGGGSLVLEPGSLALNARAGPVLLKGQAGGRGHARLVTPGWVLEGEGTFQAAVHVQYLMPLYTLLTPEIVERLGGLADPEALRIELEARTPCEPFATVVTCTEGQVGVQGIGDLKGLVGSGTTRSLVSPVDSSAPSVPLPRLQFPPGAGVGPVAPALRAALPGPGRDAALALGVELGLTEYLVAAEEDVRLGTRALSTGLAALDALRRWDPDRTFHAVRAPAPPDARPPLGAVAEDVQARSPSAPHGPVERALQLRTSGKAEERLEGLFELVRLGHVPSFRTLAQEIADEEGTFLVRAMEVTLREAPVAMRRRLLGRMAADLWRHLKLAPLAPALGELLGHESPELAADAAEALAVLGLPESVTAYADWLARLAPESPGFPRALAGMGRFPGAGAAVAFVGGLGKAPDAARRRDLVARWTARDQAALRALETFVAAETAPGVRAAALARLIARGAGTKEGLEALLPALAPDDLAAALEAFRDAPGRVTPRLLHAALESADPAVRLGAVGLIRDGEPPPVSDPDTLARLGRVVEARIREGKGTDPAEEAARTALAILARARAPGVPRWCDRLEGEPELLWSDTVAIARVLTGDDRGEDPLWRRLQRPEAQERILEALSRLAGPVPPSITGLSAAVGGARSGASTTSRVLAQQLAYRPRQEGAPGGLDVTEDLDPWVVLEQAVRRFGANRREGLPLLEEVLDAIPAAWPEWCQTRLLGEARTGGLLVSDLGELRDLLDREPRAMGVVAAGLARLLPEFLRTGPPQVLLARPELWLRAEGESVPGRALEGLERIEELRRRTREAFAEAARHWGLQPGGERGVRLAVRGLLRFQDGRTREALRTLVPRGTHSSNFTGIAARLSGASSTVFQASGLVAR